MVFGEFNLREKVHIYSWQIVYPFNYEILYVNTEHATKNQVDSYEYIP